jgi:Holliday junction resolvase
MTPEAKVKARVKEILKEHKAYYFNPVTGGYGASGVPDIVACYKGVFIGIEVKAGKNQPTALQEKNLFDIVDSGGIAVLVNGEGIKYLKAMFEEDLPKAGVLYDLLKE